MRNLTASWIRSGRSGCRRCAVPVALVAAASSSTRATCPRLEQVLLTRDSSSTLFRRQKYVCLHVATYMLLPTAVVTVLLCRDMPAQWANFCCSSLNGFIISMCIVNFSQWWYLSVCINTCCKTLPEKIAQSLLGMSFWRLKMHKILFTAGAVPRTRLASSWRSPRYSSQMGRDNPSSYPPLNASGVFILSGRLVIPVIYFQMLAAVYAVLRDHIYQSQETARSLTTTIIRHW